MATDAAKAHRQAALELSQRLHRGRFRWVFDADIKGFFDNIDHDWLMRMLEQRIDDQAFLGLIRKWLKAGILEEDGKVILPVTGTPQGGVVSAVLANIYLHYRIGPVVRENRQARMRRRCNADAVR